MSDRVDYFLFFHSSYDSHKSSFSVVFFFSLSESLPKVIHTPIPVVLVTCTVSTADPDPKLYPCPVYKRYVFDQGLFVGDALVLDSDMLLSPASQGTTHGSELHHGG